MRVNEVASSYYRLFLYLSMFNQFVEKEKFILFIQNENIYLIFTITMNNAATPTRCSETCFGKQSIVFFPSV